LNISVKVLGGGSNSQAHAVRHGLAHALIQLNQNFRKPLKKAGFLTRDARKKERKKPGLKRARRAPQWTKR
jgi:small subunit ribosomal protein S9